MNYSGIIKNDFSAAPGVSVSLFVSGCANQCPGCHNPELWDPAAGQLVTEATYQEIVEALTANDMKRNLCLMGGDPLYPGNLEGIARLLANMPKENIGAIWLWTGYTYEYLQTIQNENLTYILSNIDVLVDGPYLEECRDITLAYRGSFNQRIIDMKQTIKKGDLMLWEN